MKKYLVRSLALLMALLLAVPPVGVLAEEPEPVSTEISVEETAGESPAAAEPEAESGTESLPEEAVTEETVTEEPEIGFEIEPEPEVEPEPEIEAEPETETEVQPEAEEPAVSLMGEVEDVELLATTASGTCGTNLTWTLSDTGVLTISGTGAMTDFGSYSSVPWYSYRNDIKSVVVENGVTTIGGFAFSSCFSLASVELPAGLTFIGTYAFYKCYVLSDIELPDSVTTIGSCAFYHCYDLASIVIPEGVAIIPDHAFYECTSLVTVDLPDGLTTIQSYAFRGCTALANLEIPDSVTSIQMQAFYDCKKLTSAEIPGGVTSISEDAFYQCAGLKTLTIAEGVTSIGYGAFKGCSSLTAVEIPASVTSIGNYAFSVCTNLRNIAFKGNAPTISQYAFWDLIVDCTYPANNTTWTDSVLQQYGAGRLTWKAIPSGKCGENLTWTLEDGTLTISGTGAMADYSSYSSVPWYAYTDDIETVVVENGVTSIGRFAFRTCSALTAVQLPSGLVSIGEEAFSFCSSLTAVEIPAGVTSIGDLAFAACLDLTEITVASGSSAYCSVDGVLFTKDKTKLLACPMGNVRTAYEIPDGVTTIEDGAFYTCNNLTAVIIPDSVTSIGMAAFFNCSDLSEITFEGNAPTIGSNAFTYVTATCTYPAAASGWTDSVRQNYGGTLTWQATGSSSTGEVTLDVTGLESDHPYASSTNKTWELSHPGATSITLTFDTLTELENNYDKLYIYDENDTQVAVYTGTSLAGQTITVEGSGVKLKLTSDGSVQKWGFRVTEAVAKFDGESEPDEDAPTVEGTYGTNLTWKLVGGTLIISGTGAMADLSHPADQPWYDYRNQITSVTVSSGVTTVGQFAFRDLYALKTVSLASTVTEIGPYAFLSAIELTTVSMPGVETIGECAFGGCTGMTSVTLPTSLRVIEDRAFEACSKLASVTLPSGLTTIGQCAFRSCAIASDTFNIPASVTEIGGGAFAGTQIKNYSVASGNTAYKVEKYTLLTADGSTIVCFAPGQSYYNYTISMSKEKILPYAFYGATGLTIVEFESPYDSYMTEIGECAFEGCTGLTTIKNLPPSLRSVGNRAFYGCTGLTTANYLGTADLWDEFVHVESSNEKLTNILTYGTVAHVTHPVCGLECTCEDIHHKPIRWYGWTGTSASSLVQNYYYLTGDVTRETYAQISSAKYICLNDHTLETNGEQPGFWVTSTGKFTITDCGDSGTLSSDDHNSSVGSTAERGIENEGTFTLYNGTVEGGAEGVSNNEGATLNVYGGTIRGGEMSICDWGGTVNLYGGTMDGMVDTTDSTTCLVDGAVFKSNFRNYGTAAIQSGTFECEELDSFWPAAIVNYGTMTIEDVDVSFVGDEYGDGIRNSGTLHLKGGSLPAIKRTSGSSTTQYYGLANTGADARAYISGTPDLKAVSVAYPGTLSFASQDGSAAYTGTEEILFRVDSSTFGSGVAASNVTATIMNDITQINLTGTPSNMDGDLSLEGTDLMLKGHVASGFCGANLTWILTKDGTLTISGTGDMYANSQSWYNYRAAIKKAIIEDGATSIGGYSFENCSNMAEITIPESVTDIGNSAFYGCKSLTEIDLPSGITDIELNVFQDCTGLTFIEIPEGVTHIYGSAFRGCTNLASVTLPESLTEIWSSAFQNCTSLTEIVIPEDVTSLVGSAIFKGCTALKNVHFMGAAPSMEYDDIFTGVTADCYYPASAGGWTESVRQNYGGTLTWKAVKEENPGGQCGENLTWKLDTETGTLTISGTGAMYDFAAESAPWIAYYEDIETVVVEDGVTTIGSNAFDSLGAMTTVTLPEGITSIGTRAFVHCQSLTEIDLPDSVTAIGNYAFYGCTALTAVAIPDSVATIGNYAFEFCSALNTITFEGDAPVIASDAFTDVTATAYYPYGDATWTEAKRDNYGGTLTWKTSAPETFPGAGSGTEAEPYQVDSPEALDALRYFEDAHFIQTGDIDMTGVDWTPIPAFSGTYDGGDHKITGLTAAVTKEGSTYFGGLMDTATGEIKNLHLENASVTVTAQTDSFDGRGVRVGGIVGWGYTISNCSVSGTVQLSNATLGSSHVGGIAGEAEIITDCINRATVTVTGATDSDVTSGGAGQYVGGIAGYATTVARCANLGAVTVNSAGDFSRKYWLGGVVGCADTVTESYNRGAVTLTHSHTGYAGGICGASGTVDNCYNAGPVTCTVTDSFDGIGGIVGGWSNNQSAKNCYNAGVISVTGGDEDTTIGGISGRSSATLTNCWYLDTTTATTADTATALTAEAMGNPASFAGFDFSTVWCYGTDADYRYPVLRAFGDVGHVFPTYTYNNDATCTGDGTETAVCAVCGTVTDTRPVPGSALGHTEVADEAVPPTCGKTGLTAGSHCGVCGEPIVAQETVPALGHNTVTDEAVEATCTETGLTEGSHCDVCGETLVEQETVPELGHNTVTDEAVEATCTETGLTEGSHCDRCGEVFTAQETVPALGHSYGENGLCGRCGVQSPDPTGTCGTVTWVLRDDVLILAPTDGEEGTMTGYASAAKYPWSNYADDITEIEVGEGVLNVSAFAFADMGRLESVFLSATVEKIGEGAFADSGRGLEITICNPDCQISNGDDGETLSGDAWILGYTDSTAEEFAEEHGYDFCGTSNRNKTPGHRTVTTLVEANCVEGQHELTICDNGCGYEKKGKYRTDPSGIHSFDDKNLCTVCGFHGTQDEDGTVTPILSGQCGESLYWALSDDKTTLTLTGTGAMWSYEKATYLAAEEDDVDERDSSTAPWNYYASEIETLVLPEGMTTVGSYGFAWLSNLETLTLPGTLTGIGIASFRGCRSITGTLVIPDKVISIGQSAFQGCRSFTGLELGEGLVTIFDSAFSGFGPRKEEPIENLTIPANVEHINADAFAGAAFGGTLTILGPVEELAEGAFNGCHFDEVVLAEGVAILREQALSFGDVEGEDLTALTIHLPLSLERIDRWAIDGYESGEALTLKYAGCEGRWDALVDSGDIDDRMTARDVNVVTADHCFTTYTPNADGTTETASCDFGCGETDTRDIPVVPDPIDGVQAIYVEDNRLVLLQNVPEDTTVIVAAYENGQMVYSTLRADAPANTSFLLPEEVQDAELRIFFLNGSGSPMGKFIPLSI